MSAYMTLITGVNSIEELKLRIQENKLEFKEDDDLIIIYSPVNNRTENQVDNDTKSLIIDKHTLKPIVTQYNKLLYNDEATKFLVSNKWENVTIKYCYEGTMISVFHAYDKWYVSTRKCLDAKTSYWINGMSYYDLFVESIEGRFTLDDLNKDYCYHFILLHNKNKNIVDYTTILGKFYKTVALAMVTEKYTLKRVEHDLHNVILPQKLTYNNLDEAISYLKSISNCDVVNQKITTEGFIIEYYENDKLTLLKLQTDIYKYIASYKPNVSNIDAMFLELYQENKLHEISPFFTHQCNQADIINRIHSAMKTISNEFLNLYHMTRSHKNEKLYDAIPSSYKRALYVIHGKYLEKKTEPQKEQTSEVTLRQQPSITIYDVYDCLKKIDHYCLRNIFVDRLGLLQNEKFQGLLKTDCFDALLQGEMMKTIKPLK